MEDTEKKLDDLELQMPIQSGTAVLSAYEIAMATGRRVLENIDGVIRDVSAAGSPKVKVIGPDFHVGAGKKIKIR